MAQDVLQQYAAPTTLKTTYHAAYHTPEVLKLEELASRTARYDAWIRRQGFPQPPGDGMGSTGKGILIGMLSAFGSALLVAFIIGVVYFFRYTNQGRILLDRIGRPGEFDDEQQFLREEEEALEEMDEPQRAEYMRAKGGLPGNMCCRIWC